MKKTAALLLLFVLFFPSAARGADAVDFNEVLKKAIADTGEFMLTQQKGSGNFTYEYHPYWDESIPRDNDVRQVAAMITLGQAFEITGDVRTAKALKKTADYWMKRSAVYTAEGQKVRVVGSANANADLGTTALYIVGVAPLKEADPAWFSKNETALKEMAALLRWMKKSSGGFAKQYAPDMTAKEKERMAESGYFDGEALLALSVIDGWQWWPDSKDFLFKAYGDVAAFYGTHAENGLYLWFMTVSRDLYARYRDPLFFDFAKTLHEAYLKTHALPARQMINNCSLMEGVNAYLDLSLAATGKRDEALQQKAEAELTRLLKLQIKRDSRYKVSLGDRIQVLNPSQKGIGGFLTSLAVPLQRIDYQQHCVSAMGNYVRYRRGFDGGRWGIRTLDPLGVNEML